MVRRIFVEKIKGFDVEAGKLLEDIRTDLMIPGLKGLRVVNRYDIENLDEETYRLARTSVFAEPAIDLYYEEELPLSHEERAFAAWYLPGQYDQRADSAVQCIRLIQPDADPVVRFARIICLTGKITEEEFARIQEYCINPVDSEIAGMDKPETLAFQMEEPQAVASFEGFSAMTADELEDLRLGEGFAMSQEDLAFVQEYFAREEMRDPTVTELKVIDTYWSDHCRHTTFFTELTDIQWEDGPYEELIREAYGDYLELRDEVYGESAETRPVTLMDMAVIGAKYLKKKGLLQDLDESEEINACSIKIKASIDGSEEDWVVMFKNETHNHPTEIEPFGGAATCLGGAIRDPLSGRSYVYQAMRVTGAGDPRTPLAETLPGKLPQIKITRGAAAGYSSYGNQIGLATGQVREFYHPGFVAKRMEVGAVIGAAPLDHIRRETPASGDCIILVGGRTGRDGCGGATGSSKGHTEESILQCGAEVQKGNPPVERNLQRLFRRKEAARLIKRCNDFGAGGVSVAIGELADSLEIYLDRIPKKYEGLDGTELAISESQERMAVVVSLEDAEAFIKLAEEENLEATTVAEVTDTGRIRMHWQKQRILDLSREFLNTNGVRQKARVLVGSPSDPKEAWKPQDDPMEILQDLNSCSQKGLFERFDSTIGAGTIVMPAGGLYQQTSALGMAAKLPILKGETETATLMTFGFDPFLAEQSPFHGAYYAVIDSVTKQVAMGGHRDRIRLSFQEYFESLGNSPVRWGKPFSALLGALKVQRELEISAIGGKDSMSGTFKEINVPPSLISFAVSVIEPESVLTNELKHGDSFLYWMPAPKGENGILNLEQYKKNMDLIARLNRKGKLLAAGVIGMGGILSSLMNMAVGNRIGLRIGMPEGLDPGLDWEKALSCPDYGGLILQLPEKADPEKLLGEFPVYRIGETTGSGEFALLANWTASPGEQQEVLWTLRLGAAAGAGEKTLESIFPLRTPDYKETRDKSPVETYAWKDRSFMPKGGGKPRILIPVFPGTNCEVDSERAFRLAGGEPEILVLRNQTEGQLKESILELEKKIRQSQIIMLPGGFSGGDEPDGSAKFITAVFRNPAIADSVMELLNNRDGLMLGICNGFQALIKLGLVPFGEIRPMTKDSPTLTYNKIGRHVSGLIRTRIASVKSPWMAGVEVGDIHTLPISHGEGRFIAGRELLAELASQGQITTQYVDLDDRPTMDIPYNPNYSDGAVEGITSPDGRVLGKMGHSERIGKNLYKNVPGDYDQQIFVSGVRYFE